MKISLKNLNLKEVDKLTREQLKDVLGGMSGTPLCNCDNPDDCGGYDDWTCSSWCEGGTGAGHCVAK